MAYFADADELYRYVGGVFRAAAEHPEVGQRLAAAGLTAQIYYSDPVASTTVRLHVPMTVEDGGEAADADVVLRMPGDIADRYWRGEYNLAVGIAKGKVQARGAVNEMLALVPLLKPMYPLYRSMVAAKDSAAVVG